jgi:hypothetical protein
MDFLDKCSKKPQISNFIIILPLGTSFSMRADGRDDMHTASQTDRQDKANSRFTQFGESA